MRFITHSPAGLGGSLGGKIAAFLAVLALGTLAACSGEAEPALTDEAMELEPLPEIKFSILATESSQTLRPL